MTLNIMALPTEMSYPRMSKRMLGLDKAPPKRPWYKSLPGSGLYLAVAAVGALAGAVAAVYKFRDMGVLPTSAAA